MLLLIKAVSAVYFYHRYSKSFLGVVKRSNYPFYQVATVDSSEQAANFRIREGWVSVDRSYNPVLVSDVTETPGWNGVRILHPTSNMCFDSRSGTEQDGNALIFYSPHNGAAQAFTLNLLADFSFALGWSGKCFKYWEPTRTFFSGPCTDLQTSSFDLYAEALPEKKVIRADIYNLKNDQDDMKSSASNNKVVYPDAANDNIHNPNKLDFKKIVYVAGAPIKTDIHGSDFIQGKTNSKTGITKVKTGVAHYESSEYEHIDSIRKDFPLFHDQGPKKPRSRRHLFA